MQGGPGKSRVGGSRAFQGFQGWSGGLGGGPEKNLYGSNTQGSADIVNNMGYIVNNVVLESW